MTRKTFISLLVMIAGTLAMGFLTPWWTSSVWILIVAAVGRLNEREGMTAGALAIGIVWLGMARYMSFHDDADIISKTGTLLGGLSHSAMMGITLLIGFITGLLSGWLGSSLGKVFFHKNLQQG